VRLREIRPNALYININVPQEIPRVHLDEKLACTVYPDGVTSMHPLRTVAQAGSDKNPGARVNRRQLYGLTQTTLPPAYLCRRDTSAIDWRSFIARIDSLGTRGMSGLDAPTIPRYLSR
jgi:hypothetical protein